MLVQELSFSYMKLKNAFGGLKSWLLEKSNIKKSAWKLSITVVNQNSFSLNTATGATY